MKIIDVNANLSRWPFRRVACDRREKLVAKLKEHGVEEAWVGSLDGLLHRDVGGVNARLAEACKDEKGVRLVPFGTVNPTFPDWREDLRRCHEDYRMPGVRLQPNYQGYGLDLPALAELLALAAKRRLIVQIAMRMEDTRTQHPLMQVPDVNAKPLAELLTARPGPRVVLLNWPRSVRGALLAKLTAVENVYFDIAMNEGVGGVGKLLAVIPSERLLFGSHLPLFNLESSILKLQESVLTPAQLKAITHANAQRLMKG